MLGWDRVPAEVLDGDPSLRADGFEANVELGFLVRCERGLAPGEDEPMRGLPRTYVTDDERGAIVVVLHESAIGAAFEREHPVASLAELEQPVGAPPLPDVLGEHSKGVGRCGRYPQRDHDS